MPLNFLSDNAHGIADGHCRIVGRDVGGKLPIYLPLLRAFSVFFHLSASIPTTTHPSELTLSLWSTHAVCHGSHKVTSRDNIGECVVPSVVHQFHSYQEHQHRMNALLRQTCAVSIVIKPSATIKALRQEQQRPEPCINSQREPANTSNNVLSTASRHNFRASFDISNILAHTFEPIFCIF